MTTYKLFFHGYITKMTLEDIRARLGSHITPVQSARVTVTPCGTIDCTVGTPQDIRVLIAAVEQVGFKPSRRLQFATKRT